MWLTGSLNGRGWEHVPPLGVRDGGARARCIVLLTRGLRALQLGDDTAKGSACASSAARRLIIVAAVGLAAVATAAAGPVAFVAFVSPPIARRLVGDADVVLVAVRAGRRAAAAAADLVARRACAPTELPVGIVTGVIGAPYLLWLLAPTNRVGTG